MRYGKSSDSVCEYNVMLWSYLDRSSKQCPVSIGVGAGKFLRRNFSQISPNLPEKLLCAKHSMKSKNKT